MLREKLQKLALDQRGTSSSHADRIWSRVNPDLWKTTRNPWLILQATPPTQLTDLENNSAFLKSLDEQLPSDGWYKKHYPEKKIAYFSMEFGLSEALPIYSGGLGMLAGDHLKSASDLGLPLTAVGLLYQVGYFRQSILQEGKQSEFYPYNEPGQLPVERLPQTLTLSLPGRDLILRIYRVQVGSINLYLLGSNDLRNNPIDRGITSELYGGGPEMRLQQEIVLGIGGYKLLEMLNLAPDFLHLNEGHAAFAGLARISAAMQKEKISFQETLEKLRPHNLFTTHTPVAAGFDQFDPTLFRTYFSQMAHKLGIPLEDLLALGQIDRQGPFNMAYLAIRLSSHVNAVSKLHAEVSRDLFAKLNVEVGHVTNGIHVPSWESPLTDTFWEKACGKERWLGGLETIEEDFRKVSDQDLWELRNQLREKLLDYAHERLNKLLCYCGLKPVEELFRPDILTLGFARRFATYKRPNLLLTDKERLLKILSNEKRPVQLLIAGKAHPHDEEGKALIAEWIHFIRNEARAHVIFLHDYDILLAQRLVQGVDLWINTPRRPWEASGTSGMKVLANGGLNLSELDGWWAEAYADDVGFALGDGKTHDESFDSKEAEMLYTLLEEKVISTFYDRDKQGVPTMWLKIVKESMAKLTPQYSTNRMVREYTDKYYGRTDK